MDQRQETAREAPHRAPEGEGLSAMSLKRVAMGLGAFVLAFVSLIALKANGFDNAPVMVLAAGFIAAVALGYMQYRAVHKRR